MEVAIGQRRKSMINVNNDDNNGDGNSNAVNSRRTSFISKQNVNDDDSDDNSVGEKEEDDDGKDKKDDDENYNEIKIKRDEELIEEYTDDHIKLDRPYMMDDDIYDIDVYKVLPRIFYYQPIFYLSRQVIELYPIQKLIAIFAITQHKYIKLLERLKSNYDEENENYHSLQVSIDKVHQRKYKFLNSSRTIVQMNYGFTLQRRIYAVLKTIVMTGIGRSIDMYYWLFMNIIGYLCLFIYLFMDCLLYYKLIAMLPVYM